MKQTNNAIKFLLAQYRAIFKHAYLKGLASAVVMTAGLAAGASNAAEQELTDLSSVTPDDNGKITIVASDADGTTSFDSLSIAVSADSSVSEDLTKVIINGNSSDDGKLAVYGEGTLDASTVDWIMQANNSSFTIDNTSDGGTTGQDKDLTFKVQSFTVSSNGENAATLAIEATKGSVSGTTSVVISKNLDIGKIGTNTGSGTVTIKGAADNSKASLKAGTINIGENGSLTLDGFSNVTADTLSVTSGSIETGTAASNAITVGSANFSSGNLTVGEALNLTVAGQPAPTATNTETTADVVFNGTTISTTKVLTLSGGTFDFTKAGEMTGASGTDDGIVIASGAIANFTEEKLQSYLDDSSASGNVSVQEGGTLKLDTLTVGGDNGTTLAATKTDASLDAASGATIDVTTLNISGAAGGEVQASIIADTLSFAASVAADTNLKDVTVSSNLTNAGDVSIKNTIKLHNTNETPSTITGNGAFKLVDSSGKLDIQGKWDSTAAISLSGTAASLELGNGADLSFSSASGKLSAAKQGTVTVKEGAKLTINDKATLEVAGTTDADNLGHILVSGGEVFFNSGSNLSVTSGDFTVTNGSSVDLTKAVITGTGSGSIVAGNSGSITFKDFSAKNINFKAEEGGTLAADKVSLGNADFASAASGAGLEIDGTLSVKDLTIEDTISATTLNGTVLVTDSLTGPSDGSAAFSLGTLQLGADKSASGSINSDLTVGNTTNVFGTWASADGKNITLNGTALNVGDDSNTAALTTNKFTSTTGNTTVASGSSFTANEIAYTAGSITINGNMTVNGNAESTVTTAGDPGYKGFTLSGATITVGNGGTFAIGAKESGFADNILNQSWENSEDDYVYNNFGQYTLNGGTLSLAFSSDTKFTAEQLKDLKIELITNTDAETGIISSGKLDIGAATLSSLDEVLDKQEDGSYTTTWTDYQNAIQDGGMADTMNDQLAATKVTGVDTAFYGNAGSVQLAEDETSLNIEDDTTLAGAATNKNNFVSTSSGDTADMDVTTSDATVVLQGSGKIGLVTLVSGSTPNSNTTLSLEAGRNAAENDKFEITVAGVQAVDGAPGAETIRANTEVKVAQNVTAKFTDNVKVDVLTFNGDANFKSGSTAKDAESNKLTTASGTTVTAGALTVNQQVNVQGDLVATTLDLTDSLSKDGEGNKAKGVVAGEVVATTFNADNISLSNTTKVTGNFNAKDVAIEKTSVVSAGSASLSGTTDIDGQLLSEKGTVTLNADSVTNVNNYLKAQKLTLTQAQAGKVTTLNVLDGRVEAQEITGASGALIAVGADAIDGETSGSTGSLYVSEVLNLGGATLKVDPEYGQKTALVAVNALKGQTVIDKETQDVGILDGNVFVGQNSALGVGVDLAGLQDVIAQYQDANGSLLDPTDETNPGKYGAIAYFDKPVSIDSKYGLVLTSGTAEELKSNVSSSTGKMQGYDPSSAYAPAGVIYFGDNTALAVNTDNTKSDSAYITFINSSSSATQGTLVADGGDIVLYGNTYNKTLQLFNKEVVIEDLDGQNNTPEASIDVISANGFLKGTLDNSSSGSVSLKVNEENIDVMMTGTSTPVQQSIVAYVNGYNGDYETEAAAIEAGAQLGTYNETSGQYKYNNAFLSQIVLGGNGSDVEKVARLGVYGGVAQAALTAGATTYEAVNSRMGVGAQNGSITFADNGQGAGLWITPVYKNHDSDGFEAQGVSYGADLDLYGVALGADYTLANGLRLGAAFNVGSGDADGQGAGAGVSNDFDYYGFTVYSGYTLDKLSVVADISYTAIDNDVEANTGVEKVTASMDSSNLSFGVTGQYAFDMNGVSVTPHAGLRYTYLDMDDYTVKGSEDIAKYAADSASIFSIPVGVTFAKEITTGAWTIKPALDLTLTANMGDDSVNGSVTWAGVENLKTNLESEVIDNFTYGATLGVSAKSGNMSFGLGVNYTGASSADEYGVSANARFVF